jgi:hypothetical protein
LLKNRAAPLGQGPGPQPAATRRRPAGVWQMQTLAFVAFHQGVLKEIRVSRGSVSPERSAEANTSEVRFGRFGFRDRTGCCTMTKTGRAPYDRGRATSGT